MPSALGEVLSLWWERGEGKKERGIDAPNRNGKGPEGGRREKKKKSLVLSSRIKKKKGESRRNEERKAKDVKMKKEKKKINSSLGLPGGWPRGEKKQAQRRGEPPFWLPSRGKK